MDAKEFIKRNAGSWGIYWQGTEVVCKKTALEALRMQKKEDEQLFRGFLLSVIVRLIAGERIDVEKEFKKFYRQNQ